MSISKNPETTIQEKPVFTIEFTNTLEDYKKLLEFGFKNNINNQKRNILILCLVYFFLLSGIFISLTLAINPYKIITWFCPIILLSTIFSVIYYLIIPKINILIGLKNMKKNSTTIFRT